MKDNLVGLAVIAVLMVGMFFGGYYSHKPEKETIKHTEYIDRSDTVYVTKYLQKPPIIIEKEKPVFQVVRDTIIETKPFVASIDTVIQRDTVYAEYHFPENLFRMKIDFARDSIQFREVETIKIKVVTIKRPWWQDALMLTGAGAVGFGAGRIR